MTARNKTERLAGFFYLMVVIGGMISLIYIPSKLILRDNAGKTVENIRQSEELFRLGIVSGIVTYVAFILLPLTLYKLLSEVNKSFAMLMVVFALASVPVSFANMSNQMAVLSLLSRSGNFVSMDASQLQTMVMLHLDYYNNGIQLVSIFWGLWLFPFGYLVFKSGFLPKVLGVFLMVGCFCYLIDFLGSFLFMNYSKTVLPSFIHLPSAIGEFGICLWLLVMGTGPIKSARK
jgi:hypothetical protein